MRIAEASRFHILPLVREIPATWHKQQNQKLIYVPITVKSSLYLRWNLCLRLCSSSEDDADSFQMMKFELYLDFETTTNSLEAFFYFGANNEQNHLFVFALIFMYYLPVISSHFIISISQKSAFPNCNTYKTCSCIKLTSFPYLYSSSDF